MDKLEGNYSKSAGTDWNANGQCDYLKHCLLGAVEVITWREKK